jgi:hypothetical protein
MDKISMKVRLSLFWIVIMLNMIFADILSIMVELVNGDSLEIPGDVKTIMAIAALITNIPILMIFLSRVLTYKVNRIVNIVAAILTIIYVIGGGDSAPHYIIIASIEVLFLLLIIAYAIRWKNTVNE